MGLEFKLQKFIYGLITLGDVVSKIV